VPFRKPAIALAPAEIMDDGLRAVRRDAKDGAALESAADPRGAEERTIRQRQQPARRRDAIVAAPVVGERVDDQTTE
jgi:hypothetical protein